ncbi:hypothetical protein CLOM_g6803 [Closterium sp. NIES-68]|nr:hypothetical protein CLOM_g6803 [Closterium sp. NIES-68]
MKGGDYDKDSSEDRYPGQFFFVSTQAAAAAGGVDGFEEPATVGKVTLHSLDFWGTTLRTLFAAAAIKGWVVKQMDIVTAFLNGVLEEETYMEQPESKDLPHSTVIAKVLLHWLRTRFFMALPST